MTEVNFVAAGEGVSVRRRLISDTEERIAASVFGREISALVLLPPVSEETAMPLLLALHNLGNDARSFADLIRADRLTACGIVVVIPQANGLLPRWEVGGLNLMFRTRYSGGRCIDDLVAIEQLIAAAKSFYPIRPSDVNVAGFSQGAIAALCLTRRLNSPAPGTVRRVFAVAGGIANRRGGGLAMAGADVTYYEPMRDRLMPIASLLMNAPKARRWLRDIASAKGCALAQRTDYAGVRREVFHCEDGRTLTHFAEEHGEHGWPGQPRHFDSSVTGRGSISQLDMTDLIISSIKGS